MNESFDEWWERSTPPEDLARNKITKSKAKRAYTAGLFRAAEIIKPEVFPNNKYVVNTIFECIAAIRKEAGDESTN